MLRKNHPHGGRVLSLFMKKKEHQIQGLNSRALRPDGVGSLEEQAEPDQLGHWVQRSHFGLIAVGNY